MDLHRTDHRATSLRTSRLGFALVCLASLLAAWVVLRLLLIASFAPSHIGGTDLLKVFLLGAHRDLLTGLVICLLPLLGWLVLVRNRWFNRGWHRLLLGTVTWLWAWIGLFLLAAEFFFFEEFRSRFNTVAVDYVLYPHEVFINIWDSYPVVPVVLACGAVSAAWAWLIHRWCHDMWTTPVPWRVRLKWFGAAAVLALGLAPTVSIKGTQGTRDRTLNEIANNGTLSFASAAWTHELDFTAFYKTIPKEEAYARVRTLLRSTNSTFTGGELNIRRRIRGDENRPRLNVVLVLEESLGSEFWGCLGRTNQSLTPEMDRLATTEGLLFTNIYASGNRTVRGMEGVLSSFPPLPGDSIVKRKWSDHVETLARTLKRDDYETLFLYGGRGIFDGMRSFAVRNGYDRFIEQKDFPQPAFTTIWGVSDEDLFARSVAEFRTLSQQGRPFFGTILTVSNHKPYTYPTERIAENPNERRRENAVKYTDYALGRFFEAAKREPFWTNTIFVVVADHGARVYGSQSIPMHSYEIPLVILGPAVVDRPARIPALGCSLDVAPTLLGLIGRPYDSVFFGRDLLQSRPDQERVLLHHNRDIGLYSQDRLLVLGLRQTEERYVGNPKSTEPKLVNTNSATEDELALNAIALFQVANDLYVNRRYRVDAPDPASPVIAQRAAKP